MLRCACPLICFSVCSDRLRHAAHKFLPTLENFLTTPTGESGWQCSFFNHDTRETPVGAAVADFVLRDTRVKLNDFLPAGLTSTWTIKLIGKLTVDKTALYELGLTVAGRAKLFINGKLLIDNWTKQRPGEFFYGYVFWLLQIEPSADTEL